MPIETHRAIDGGLCVGRWEQDGIVVVEEVVNLQRRAQAGILDERREDGLEVVSRAVSLVVKTKRRIQLGLRESQCYKLGLIR